MARVSTYLNFMGNTEEAFAFYKEVFGTEFIGGIARMGDAPSNPGMPELSDADRHRLGDGAARRLRRVRRAPLRGLRRGRHRAAGGARVH